MRGQGDPGLAVWKSLDGIKGNNFESVELRWVNLEPIIQSEIRKRKQISYINVYIWNLEKIVLTNLLAGKEWRRREWTCEHCGEGEGGTDWESSRDIYTLLLLLLSRFSRV